MDLIQAFILGMIVMLAICIVPSVIADIKKEKDDETKERVYCKDCKYCDNGECHLYAPEPDSNWKSMATQWPVVCLDRDWCGEGVRKEQ